MAVSSTRLFAPLRQRFAPTEQSWATELECKAVPNGPPGSQCQTLCNTQPTYASSSAPRFLDPFDKTMNGAWATTPTFNQCRCLQCLLQAQALFRFSELRNPTLNQAGYYTLCPVSESTVYCSARTPQALG